MTFPIFYDIIFLIHKYLQAVSAVPEAVVGLHCHRREPPHQKINILVGSFQTAIAALIDELPETAFRQLLLVQQKAVTVPA